jgi:diguanylate cyclase (GGDEF)-like protein
MSKARILVVEDSVTQAEVTKEFLERNGFEVICVYDGTSAIKAVKTDTVDVILLDLILPDINGKEVCRWLKLNSDTKSIPIIMLTVKNSLEDKVSGIEAGADDYLPKPYNEIELNAKIYAVLRTKALQDELRQKNKQMEELLAKVEFLAVTDPLTGLFNRRRLEAVLKDEWRAVKRYKNPISCLIVDIDHFKVVNDTFGHRAGDSVLKEVAAIIKQSLREVDTVARWGGEEFLIILPRTDKNNAGTVASRIAEAIAKKKFDQFPGGNITVSIGISGFSDSVDTPDKLINSADFALYEAKAKGRNRIEVSEE